MEIYTEAMSEATRDTLRRPGAELTPPAPGFSTGKEDEDHDGERG